MNKIIEQTSKYRNALASFLSKEYSLKNVLLTPAKRGFFGETWRADSNGKSYFVKLVYFEQYKPFYEHSFEVVDFLCRNGIDFINTIVQTTEGRLFTNFNEAVLGVFHWLDGENVETNETKPIEY